MDCECKDCDCNEIEDCGSDCTITDTEVLCCQHGLDIDPDTTEE
jgi:hypothetical protein